MTVEEILKALSHKDDIFPREALEQATAQKEVITPHLLKILERVADDPDGALDQEDSAYLYALYLLAQFRETQAYPLVVRIASLPPETVVELLGDTITEGLATILASVCGGDTSLITRLAENAEAEQFTRGSALSTLLALVLSGDKTRDEVMSYYSRLFDAILKEEPSEETGTVLTALANCATELCPEELYDRIKAAFESELIDEFIIDLEEVEEKMTEGKEAVLPRLRENRHYRLVESAVKEMEWWAWYRESDYEEDEEDEFRELSVEEMMEMFSYDDHVFPSHALRQAVEKKDEITPHLLKALERAADDPEDVLEAGDDSYIYAMFLLAQFREKRAYPLIIKLASHPPELVDDLLGDIPTEDLANVLASVSTGDMGLIAELAENSEAEEFARAAAIRSWLALVVSGDRSREEAMAYYKGLFEGGLEDRNEVVWSELVDAANDLYPEEVYAHIKKAYDDGLVDEYIVDPEWVDEQLDLGKDAVLADLPEWNHPVEDVTVEMGAWFENREHGDEWNEDEDWYEEDEWDEDDEEDEWDAGRHRLSALNGNNSAPAAPYISPDKVGRDDPCPCGSGKKYKRCCGA
jgi:DNA-binding transcriptional ArsR family regulator